MNPYDVDASLHGCCTKARHDPHLSTSSSISAPPLLPWVDSHSAEIEEEEEDTSI